MNKDMIDHCKNCKTCLHSKVIKRSAAPLEKIEASRPWQMVGVDVLKVPMSRNGNQYLLVAQDYFTKFPFAFAMPDQTADRIARTLVQNIFSVFGPPEILHSDQGRNFESTILRSVCEALGIKKTRTVPYHPSSDGLVERMNRSILQLLRSVVGDHPVDWEDHLPFVLYMYRTSTHTTTKETPFSVLFGYEPRETLLPAILQPPTDQLGYRSQVFRKLLIARERVEAHLAEEARKQSYHYDRSRRSLIPEVFHPGEEVWLVNPTARKLDAKHVGPFRVIRTLGPVTLEIEKSGIKRVEHVNHLRKVRPHNRSAPTLADVVKWQPPHTEGEHNCVETDRNSHNTRGRNFTITRSGRVSKPPDRLMYH